MIDLYEWKDECNYDLKPTIYIVMKVVNNKKIIFRDVKAAVVDDNELNLKVADGFISRYGIKCELLNSGIKLLNKMQTGKSYDIVFLDHMMPELDGIETVQKIRAEGNEYWKNMPIIALTANAIKGVENKLIDYIAMRKKFKRLIKDQIENAGEGVLADAKTDG